MVRRILGIGAICVCCALAAFWGAARAEQPSDRAFDEAVDLSRFRKGNLEWDTQELIASGLTALHEEHQRILLKLGEIQDRLSRLERDSAERK